MRKQIDNLGLSDSLIIIWQKYQKIIWTFYLIFLLIKAMEELIN